MNTGGLGHPNYRASDVIRDKRTGIDYVIVNVAAFAVGVGVVIYCSSMVGNTIREFRDTDLEHLLRIQSNPNRGPVDVKASFNTKIEKYFNGNQELIQKINHPDNQILKDLMFVVGEADETKFDKTLIDLARSMVYAGQGIPSQRAIREALISSTSQSNIELDFLEDLGRRIYQESITQERMRVGQGKVNYLSEKQSGFVTDFLKVGRSGIQDSDEHLLRTARTSLEEEIINYKGSKFKFNQETELTHEEKSVLDLLIGDTPQLRGHLLQGRYANDAEGIFPKDLIYSGKPQDRIKHLLQNVFNSGETIHNSQGWSVLSAYRRGKKNVITQAILGTENNRHPAMAKSFAIIRNAQMQSIGDKRGHYIELASQRNRKTALGRTSDVSLLRSHLDTTNFTNLADYSSSTNKSNVLSVDMPTFLDEILEGRTLKMDGKTVSTSSRTDLIKIKKFLNLDKNNQLFLSPSELNKTLGAQEVNLNRIKSIDSIVRSQLSDSVLAATRSSHGVDSRYGFVFNRSKISKIEVEGNFRKRKSRVFRDFNRRIENSAGLPKLASGHKRVFYARSNILENGQYQTLIGTPESVINGLDASGIEPNLDMLHVDVSHPSNLSLQYVDVPEHHVASLLAEPTSDLSYDILSQGRPVFDIHRPELQNFNLRSMEGLEAASDIVGGIGQVNFHNLKGNTKKDALAVFEEARSARKLALSVIKTPSGEQFKLMGSDMSISFEEQIRRAQKFYSGRGAVLDIETELFRGKKVLSELTMGINSVTGFHTPVNYADLRSDAQRIQVLKDLVNHLKTVDVVGTQGATDFEELERMTQELLSRATNQTQIRELKSIQRSLAYTSKHKVFDVMTIFQVSRMGELGDLSQESLTAMYMGKEQIHTSLQDVLDSFKLISAGQDDFDKYVNQVDLSGHTHAPIFFDSNPMSNFSGKLMQPVEVVSNSQGHHVIWKEHELIDGIVTETGNFFQETASNTAQLGARFNSRSVFDVTNSELLDQYTRTIQESSGRTVRGYMNPLAKSYWDELDSFDPISEGPFSRTQLLVDSETRKLWKNIESEINGLAKPDRYWDSQSRSEQVSSIISNALEGSSVPETLRIRVEHQLNQMSGNVAYKGRIMGEASHSLISEFHESNLGKFLIAAAERDAAGSNGREYSILSELVIGKAAEMAETHSLMRKVNYGSRINLRMLGFSSSKQIRDLKDFNKIDQAATELSGKILTAFRNEESGPIGSLLEELGFDQNLIKNTMSSYAKSEKLRDNLWDWKNAISDIKFLSDSDEHSILKKALFAISDSNMMRDVIKQGIVRGKVGEELDYGKSLINRAESISIRTRTPFRKSINKVMLTELTNNKELITNLMSNQTEQLDFQKFVHLMDRSQLEEITKLYQTIDTHLKSQVNVAGSYADFMESINAAKDAAYAAGETGIQLQSAGGRNIMSTMESVLNQAQIAPPTPSPAQIESALTKVTAQAGGGEPGIVAIQHELVMRTANIKPLNSMVIPLLAVGGVLGLISATHKVKDKFSQGNISNQQGDPISLSSEIPGKSSGLRSWHGESTPFQLDITFSGFVNDKEHHDAMVSQVMDSLSGEMEFRKVDTKIDDKRQRSNSRKLVSILR